MDSTRLTCYKVLKVKRTGRTASSIRATGVMLDSARFSYFWRFR